MSIHADKTMSTHITRFFTEVFRPLKKTNINKGFLAQVSYIHKNKILRKKALPSVKIEKKHSF